MMGAVSRIAGDFRLKAQGKHGFFLAGKYHVRRFFEIIQVIRCVVGIPEGPFIFQALELRHGNLPLWRKPVSNYCSQRAD
ncbi:MAG: hypothetical protein V1766_11045, partial [Pseudomonadota bacterium]